MWLLLLVAGIVFVVVYLILNPGRIGL